MKDYRIGQRVIYTASKTFKTECMIVGINEDNHTAIAVEINEPKPLRLLIDADTDYMFKVVA